MKNIIFVRLCVSFRFSFYFVFCDSVPLKCSPFHSALVSLQSLYTADSRKCKSLSPKWHSAQGSEGQYMESVHLNQRKCFFVFFWGKGRGWGLPWEARDESPRDRGLEGGEDMETGHAGGP